jgi:hypothetical protein
MAQGTQASAACVVLAGTADGFDKETAVSRAQRSVEDYIQQYKTEHHLGAVSVSAMRAEPQPYWRGRVSENMMYRPDIVTDKSYAGLARRGLHVCLHLGRPGVLVAFASHSTFAAHEQLLGTFLRAAFSYGKVSPSA